MSIVLGRTDISSKALASVTTVSGLAFAPAAVIFWQRQNADVGDSGAGSGYSGIPTFGVLTAAAQFALSSGRQLANVDRRHASGIVHDDTGRSASGGIFVGALTSDGFTLTCTDATGTNHHLYWMAIGGPGVTATAGSFTAPAAPGVESHSLGIEPHLLFHWSLGTLTEGSNGNDHFSFGMVAQDLTQCSYAGRSGVNNAAGSLEYCTDQEGFAYVSAAASATLTSRGVATAWTADGVTVDWAASASEVYHYLAIRGLSSRVVGFATSGTDGGTVTVSGLPWQPDAGVALSALRIGSSFHAPGTPTLDTSSVRRRRFTAGAWVSASDRFGMQSNTYETGNSHESRYGTGMIAAHADQDGSARVVQYDLDSVTGDGFSVLTDGNDFSGTRPMAMLVLNNTVPSDDDDPIWASTDF